MFGHICTYISPHTDTHLHLDTHFSVLCFGVSQKKVQAPVINNTTLDPNYKCLPKHTYFLKSVYPKIIQGEMLHGTPKHSNASQYMAFWFEVLVSFPKFPFIRLYLLCCCHGNQWVSIDSLKSGEGEKGANIY